MKKLKIFAQCHPLSTILVIVIWILCFIPIPDSVPLEGVPMMDKWTHFVMYGSLCTVLWIEQGRKGKANLRIAVGFIFAPVLMSGIIELGQAYCTGGMRSGEWLDFLANTIGVILGNAIGILLAWYLSISRKDS